MVQNSDFGERLVRLEEKVTQMENRLDEAETEMKVTAAFVQEHRTLEAERDRVQQSQHQENARLLNQINAKTAAKSMWWTIIGVAWTAAGAIIALVAIIHEIRH